MPPEDTGSTVIPVKVRIIGTPSAADLDKLTETVAAAVRKQLRAANAAQAKQPSDSDRPISMLDLRYRWVPLADALRRAAQDSETNLAQYLAVADEVAEYYTRSRDETGSITYRIDREQLLDLGLSAQHIAELDRIFTETGFAPEGTAVRDWAIDDG
ncbi:hypothetical protein ACW9HQ_38005, partial [Nocardia gipuzkoensis]